MLALLQRLITLSLIAAACGWLLYFRRSAPVLAVAGFLVILLSYTVFLAIEFAIGRQVNKSDPAPQASTGQLLAAWLAESLIAPQVFCWRQPFRSRAIADQLEPPALLQGRPGVVLSMGFSATGVSGRHGSGACGKPGMPS